MKKLKLTAIIVIIIYALLVLLAWYYFPSYVDTKEKIRGFISGYDILSPILFMLLQILQVIFLPISHYPFSLAGGFIFGSVPGFFYNWIGTSVGTIIMFLFARKCGRPIVDKLVNKKIIKKYDKVIKKINLFGLFLIFLFPIFPDDSIACLIGLSSLNTTGVIVAIILGKMGTASLSFIADEMVGGIGPLVIIHLVSIVLAVIYFYKKGT